VLRTEAGQTTKTPAPEAGALVYFCLPGQGRPSAALAPQVLGEAEFFASVPAGKWDAHLVRPGHATIINTVTVPADDTVRIWFRPPAESQVEGRLLFTLAGKELNYDVAKELVGAQAVRLKGGPAGELAPQTMAGPRGEFFLAAPGKGKYHVEVFEGVATPYGPAMLQPLGSGPELEVAPPKPAETKVVIEIMPILQARLKESLAAGETATAAAARMKWLEAWASLLADNRKLAASAAAVQRAARELTHDITNKPQ
jgi:hypothetical protein